MEIFNKKHLLLDTNLLIKISQYFDSRLFDDFLGQLEKNEIKPVIDQAVLFEFNRGSKTQTHLKEKNEFLDFLLGGEPNRMVLPSSTSQEILKNAQEIAILYSHNDLKFSKQISFSDCLIAAQLMKYEDHIILATLDNKDYPLFIFDRLQIITIDAKKEILNIGFYAFNQEKFDKAKANFAKS